MKKTNQSLIFLNEASITHPRARIFCFHNAGGGPVSFKGWQKYVPNDVEVCVVQLPGHGTCMNKPLQTDLRLVVQQITEDMKQYLEIPFIFFGLSMGSLIACEIAGTLAQNNLPSPKHLVLSNYAPPYSNLTNKLTIKDYEEISDIEFINLLTKKYESMPPEILENKELLNIFIPILRSDFILGANKVELNKKFDIPITAIHCKDDASVTENQIREWSNMTSKNFKLVLLPGKHLEILKNPLPFIEVIISLLKDVNL